MSLLDDIQALTPTQYRVLRVAFQQTDTGIQAFWDVALHNSSGAQLQAVHPTSQPDAALKAALALWYNDSKTQLEAVTGLTEYIPPTEDGL
jgi:hypothetical protein